MKIDNLTNTSFDELLSCFLRAFENYYVPMPTDPHYYRARWKSAKVDFKLSYGLFDQKQLVAFIIHAVDLRFGKKIAFNTGTGVLPEYRGKRIVKSIYDYALHDLKKNGIECSKLEVIQENKKAVNAYKSVGFSVCKKYRCYSGKINLDKDLSYQLSKRSWNSINWSLLPNQNHYSWDFQANTLSEESHTFYEISHENCIESYFIISTDNRTLAQFDLLEVRAGAWQRLFSAIRSISKEIRIINVDETLQAKVKQVSAVGLANTVNQYEMELIV